LEFEEGTSQGIELKLNVGARKPIILEHDKFDVRKNVNAWRTEIKCSARTWNRVEIY